jgi:hypothetical protein
MIVTCCPQSEADERPTAPYRSERIHFPLFAITRLDTH